MLFIIGRKSTIINRSDQHVHWIKSKLEDWIIDNNCIETLSQNKCVLSQIIFSTSWDFRTFHRSLLDALCFCYPSTCENRSSHLVFHLVLALSKPNFGCLRLLRADLLGPCRQPDLRTRKSEADANKIWVVRAEDPAGEDENQPFPIEVLPTMPPDSQK